MKRKVILIGLLLILGATAVAAFAFTPRAQIEGEGGEAGVTAVTASAPAFNYQGQLLDAQGDPVTGAVPMTFKLYPTATGGTACWTENHTGGNAVEVVNGRFSVLLGQLTPISVDCLADDAYLELRINNETLTPRQSLTKAIVSNGSQLGEAIVGQEVGFGLLSAYGIDRGVVSGVSGGALTLVADTSPFSPPIEGWFRGSWMVLTSLDAPITSAAGIARINLAKDTGLGNSPYFEIYRVQNDGASEELMKLDESGNLNVNGRISTRSGADLGLQDNGGGYLSLGNNPGDNKIYLEAFSSDGSASASELLLTGRFASPMPLLTLRADQTNVTGSTTVGGNLGVNGGLNVNGHDIALGNESVLRQDGSRTLHLLPWGGAGHAFDQVCIGCGSTANLVVWGNLDLQGSCTASSEMGGNEVATAEESCTSGSIISGAYIESNLMTVAERRSERITRFTQGDLLCWTAAQQLEKCSQANTALVMGVADVSGKPIVIGAEPVKVIGPVKMGDYLVASDVPGYAIATSNPTFGIVIAQALEDFDGERGLVLAMIRKM